MFVTRWNRNYAASCLLLFVSGLVGAQETGKADEKNLSDEPVSLHLPGITLASQAIVISSVQRGTIQTMDVREGDRVTKGDVLFSLHSEVQRASVSLARVRAESTAEVDLAITRRQDAERRFDRVKKLRKEGSAPQDEYDEAATLLAQAEIEVELATVALEQARQQLAFEEARLAERTVRSPVNGYVVDMTKRRGESVEETEPVLRLVRIDPLLVQVDCPIHWAGRLKRGSEAEVVSKALSGQSRRAKVIFLSKAGDAASDTFRIKLEIPNPKHDWIAGMKVDVRFRGTRIPKAALVGP